MAELHNLNATIQAQPERRVPLLQEAYSHAVKDGNLRNADLFMLVRDIATARPSMPDHPHIINISHAANVNFGSQVGTISATLQAVSQQGANGELFAEAMKLLTEGATKEGVDPQVQREAMDLLEGFAEQGKEPLEKRKLGAVKAFLKSFPTVVSTTAELAHLWATYGPSVASLFGLTFPT